MSNASLYILNNSNYYSWSCYKRNSILVYIYILNSNSMLIWGILLFRILILKDGKCNELYNI
ncbi:hypothetical protein CNEO3_660009 [Clostridium neonatale]|uniref:Uncharacterized protein n=1 Tax=Clostridium neonatale TaxID=137838 RepID=A0AAD2DER0_9CLOT|nr:hypothetical protein CNEO2_330047 [Clostridium neonatale]CAI3204920.1 hypothetical protein CNEO2_320047 [Clostridium neonatale]CAI3205158.1 hypothetical protein CNEO2_270035 [Clostridium neonatale]CAI3236442.1 hypothetical protein CNEO2_250047 [Clostridium neonatale]CAI3237141.1 hypothetical protein CNEO2_270047 [Clostridium neonatale]